MRTWVALSVNLKYPVRCCAEKRTVPWLMKWTLATLLPSTYNWLFSASSKSIVFPAGRMVWPLLLLYMRLLAQLLMLLFNVRTSPSPTFMFPPSQIKDF